MRRIVFFIVSILFFTSFYAWTCKNVMGKEVLMFSEYGVGYIESDALAPTLFKGDAFVSCTQQRYSAGAIIAYRDSGGVRVSKVSGIEDGKIMVSQYDAVPTMDICGEVVSSIPYVGFFLQFLFSPLCFVLCFLVGGCLLIWEYKFE